MRDVKIGIGFMVCVWLFVLCLFLTRDTGKCEHTGFIVYEVNETRDSFADVYYKDKYISSISFQPKGIGKQDFFISINAHIDLDKVKILDKDGIIVEYKKIEFNK